MTRSTFPYTTPTAFRTALKERFRQIARTDLRYRLDELQRQFAYDRALARLFSSPEADHWVLKGAGALLARLSTARHSKDLDVFCATIGSYPRAGQPTSSSRVKDLVDIAIIAITQTVHANTLSSAVVSNAAMCKIELLGRFIVPGATGWAARYPEVAAEAPGPVPDFDTAVVLAGQIPQQSGNRRLGSVNAELDTGMSPPMRTARSRSGSTSIARWPAWPRRCQSPPNGSRPLAGSAT